MTYYNTNVESGTVLEASRTSATMQNEKVLELFRGNPGALFAPHEVHSALFDSDTPLTSVRRAITTLTTEGRLIKTAEKRLGPWGKLVHTWMAA